MFPVFDTSRLAVLPLDQRKSDLDLSVIMDLEKRTRVHPDLVRVARRIEKANQANASVILMMGAHVIRSGVQRYILDMMEKGHVSAIAANGACAIHDFEFALKGQTTESVAHYISDGRFGLWKETGEINDCVRQAALCDMGLGEGIGKCICQGDFPHADISLFAAAYRRKIPITVHVGIGYDIVHEHPNCDGAAWGKTSYTDFLRFAHVMDNLENGVVMNFGSSVMAPEVFLKALAMVRNAAKNENRSIKGFTTLVCDLKKLPENFATEAPKDDPAYYFRPWKTMLIRTVADRGESFFVCGDHKDTVPGLWSALNS